MPMIGIGLKKLSLRRVSSRSRQPVQGEEKSTMIRVGRVRIKDAQSRRGLVDHRHLVRLYSAGAVAAAQPLTGRLISVQS